MPPKQTALRWTLLIGLGAVVGLVAWLMVIQLALVLLTPFGTWQKPGVAKVRVVDVFQDVESQFTNFVSVMDGDQARNLTMLKGESAKLQADEEIWILENYYATTTRPAQFRLTPIRVLLEYPEPLLILALWVYRAQLFRPEISIRQPAW